MLKGAQVFFILMLLLSALSCEYDNAESIFIKSQGDIRFTEEISQIINIHCTISGCHVSGAAIGNFSEYDQLKTRVDNGKFQIMVFDLKLMPPAGSPKLSGSDYSLLQRWIEGGTLE